MHHFYWKTIIGERVLKNKETYLKKNVLFHNVGNVEFATA
jgi:hypothetical protein